MWGQRVQWLGAACRHTWSNKGGKRVVLTFLPLPGCEQMQWLGWCGCCLSVLDLLCKRTQSHVPFCCCCLCLLLLHHVCVCVATSMIIHTTATRAVVMRTTSKQLLCEGHRSPGACEGVIAAAAQQKQDSTPHSIHTAASSSGSSSSGSSRCHLQLLSDSCGGAQGACAEVAGRAGV